MDSSMTFDVVIDEKRKYTVKMGDMLAIREERLNEIMSEHPSQYMWVASLSALARAKRQRMEIDLELAEAQFYTDLREKATKDGVKVTDKAIDHEMSMSRRLLQMRRDLVSAEEQESLCSAADQAFRHRKDCLITLAANLRATADPTLNVNQK